MVKELASKHGANGLNGPNMPGVSSTNVQFCEHKEWVGNKKVREEKEIPQRCNKLQKTQQIQSTEAVHGG